ncbi:hypothetical protein PHLGIDRAFT_130320 [Phlebiopsis gigantea 11061_1 CR5-6]|uniref:Cytochrome P450 n=1 Tax=Phlebiopsis gigantea (strain 11061_1 CR5-6) TaxID=745531 RepID=A0A0C3NER9_PHLG1|nr:hypothetical protein PHLGIDRAFT_130320 [Phlebiopsis gigantea 11061_1 CR5-6]
MPSLILLGVLFCIFSLSRYVKYRNGCRAVAGLPIMTVPCAPFSLLGCLLPTSRFNPGMCWQWDWRQWVYQRYGSETIAVVPFLYGRPIIYTSSLETGRAVLDTKNAFRKDEDATSAVLQYGHNIFTSNGDEWKRHKRILGPSFTTETFNMVWEETASLYYEMCSAEGWDTMDFSLIILARCAFNVPLGWVEQKPIAGETPFGEVILHVMDTCIARLIIPRWMYWLPIPALQRMEQAHKTLSDTMHKLIREQAEVCDLEKSGSGTERRDVMSLMVRARAQEGKLTMSDDELVGNTFFLLFAGHETMAHIWNSTLGFLGLYEEIQEEMFNEVQSIAPDDTPITFAMASQLDKLTACFIETGRLFSPGFVLVRDSTDYVLLPHVYCSGVTSHVGIVPNMRVAVDIVGLHHNPRHFPDPEAYRPERWYGVPEANVSLFSVGPRACTGRRFALTEACCFLAHLLRDWKVEIIARQGETKAQWRARVMRAHTTMTLGVGDVPVRLVRRREL